MNPKIEKLEKEIEKTKTRIAEMQAKLHKLEEQKTELENTDYVKKHISGIAAAIVGLRALPFKFSIVGACTASGMYAGIRLAISKLRIVDRGLLVKHQDILGLFQWSPVCIEKARSALLVPNPLIAEHGEVGCAQHLVKGALCEKQHCAIRLEIGRAHV